ncbi:MAG: hypothetical protein C7B45_16605 [Sulfobacillus acidophilus]|uniref:Orc1-like AAA ATPase domain-containing protein n=1 Tax=Sulfobacillus acidophilus TaxID=53633 RepID=A0A2T2WCZ0_9FIRM|nr:MAG: hypothetical protein C7B45_16605 [Sulfobacillus acidophilus]
MQSPAFQSSMALIPEPPQTLIGRQESWTSLHTAFNSGSYPMIYVWGAPGTGKTYLVRHFAQTLEKQANIPFVWAPGRKADFSAQAWLRAMAHELDLTEDSELTFDQVRSTLLTRCRTHPFHWIVDHIDDVPFASQDLAEVAQALIRQGGFVTFIGRTSPVQLWPGQNYLRSQLSTILLEDWSFDQARDFLSHHQINDEALVDHVIQITQGRPQLLAAVCDGLTHLDATQVPAEHTVFMAHAMDLNGFLIEQIFHPGSLRLTWRAGQPLDARDTLIAAASIAPMVNREWMTRVVGRATVHQAWERFVSCATLNSYRGGYYGLFPALREQIAGAVQKIRPWTWEQWLRRSTHYYLSLLQSGRLEPDQAWRLLAGFIRPRLGYHPFRSEGQSLIVRQTDHILEILTENGKIVGQVQVNVQDGSLFLSDAQLLETSLNWSQLVNLVAQQFHLYSAIHWEAAPSSGELAHLLKLLQFTPQDDQWWDLTFAIRTYAQWLQDLVAPPQGLIPGDPVSVTQAILQNLSAGNEESHPQADAYWASIADSSTFRAWFRDALNSANLGERVDGKTTLVLYYVDRRGTHEELAELLHVSRATYFRNHRQALERLAEAVFC